MLVPTQTGMVDDTDWLVWFLGCTSRAVDRAGAARGNVLHKTGFWQHHAQAAFTRRQTKWLSRILDGFEGKLATRKWAAIGKCSIATAQRDMHQLVAHGMLGRNSGGSKNTSYDLAPMLHETPGTAGRHEVPSDSA